MYTWEGIKPNLKKMQEIMDIGQPITTTEMRALIGMVHYYSYMCLSRLYMIFHIYKSSSGPKVRKIIWNNKLKVAF